MTMESGFKFSKIDGSEHIFGTSSILKMPDSYSYQKYLPEVLDQGSDPICVPCSISCFLNWRENMKDGSNKDNKVDYFKIYNSKTTYGEGMTFKEAFAFLRHEGVPSKAGDLKIKEYAMVQNPLVLKQALLMNGPCVGALPVYNYGKEFWKGGRLEGYHAISIVGYDEEGFIIRNSWGRSYANGGYTKIKYADFGRLMELWTVVS